MEVQSENVITPLIWVIGMMYVVLTLLHLVLRS
jgi:hypothetical protein